MTSDPLRKIEYAYSTACCVAITVIVSRAVLAIHKTAIAAQFASNLDGVVEGLVGRRVVLGRGRD